MLVLARSFWRSWPPPATHVLVALGMAVWAWSFAVHLLFETPLLEGAALRSVPWFSGLLGLEKSPLLQEYAAWSWEGLRAGRFWQPVTHLFVHSGLIAAAINFFLLALAGRAVEPILGRRMLVSLFLTAGMLGGALELALSPARNCLFGASAAVFGVAAAACIVWSDFDLRAFRAFRWLPVPFKARHLLLGIVLAQVAAFLFDQPGASAADHLLRIHRLAGLTGCAVGYLWARRLGFGERGPMRRRAPLPPPAIEMETDLAENPHEYIRDEIDPILDKIRARGMQSLTPGERRRLARASRMLSR